MAKELVFIQACPDDSYFIWQTNVWLESLRMIGKSDKAVSLIFTPKNRPDNPKWKQLVDLYPESEFFFYRDVDDISHYMGVYVPVLRPYILMKYFKAHPELIHKAIFYCDCDVVFTEKFNIDGFIDDDVCYLSDTNSYINSRYFDSKERDVLPEKLEEYKKRDILNEVTSLVGINREICERWVNDSGGAQYLLKNINSSFWEKVLTDCIVIKRYLSNVNKEFFESENKGFQSWCADMWSVLWNLWLLDHETKVVPEMEFAWSSDHINKLERTGILHNAGIVSNSQGEIPTFFKGHYHNGRNPFDDPHLEMVYNNEKSKTLCNHYYVNRMMDVKNKYNLSY